MKKGSILRILLIIAILIVYTIDILFFIVVIKEPAYYVTEEFDTQGIQAFNAQFQSYEGIQKGAVIRALLQKVIANNAKNWDNEIFVIVDASNVEGIQLSVNVTRETIYTANDDITKFISNKIVTAKKYKVEFEYTNTNGSIGRINKVIISDIQENNN